MKTIVFDVDDTIYDQQQPFRNAIKSVFPCVKDEDMHALYIRFRFHSDETFPKVMANEWTLEYMRFFRINESLKDLNYPTVSQEDGLTFQKTYEDELDNIVMHPEVKKVFDFLKEKNIPMGIITNGPTDHQFKKVKQLQLENWVPTDNIIISQSTGFQKPEREIFDLAAKEFGMDCERTLYVGDSFENDIAGAKNGGWKSLWFNHRLREMPSDEEAYHIKEVTSFDDLFPTIQSLFS
ncbi:HAD superfamily hydrolase [Enterococcus sp. DIV0840]|uniref:HAD family hydrolase n=1 Tax=Enterococcus ureasiticus TaxID=903984 RepID=A0A1E5GNB4_9ENTE|nr:MULTISPECIES: HAD family hydrolase [Enterococcus]MBO0435362.1 HAD family hydrolase [Enterococcus sp. DIV0849a]MBO0474004.1 HAD family hydrolase [Enterococcus ureasiticus]OEG14194.1 HAD family hydrolase [Enterococcus ureasiticus]